MTHRQRLENQRVDETEDARGGRDAERRDEDDGGREHRIPAQRAQRVRDVLPDAVEPRPDPDGPRLLARQRDVAERAPARVRRLGRRDARGFEARLLHRAMRLDLLGKIRVGIAAAGTSR